MMSQKFTWFHEHIFSHCFVYMTKSSKKKEIETKVTITEGPFIVDLKNDLIFKIKKTSR